jgi:hypothetical protein
LPSEPPHPADDQTIHTERTGFPDPAYLASTDHFEVELVAAGP